MPRIFHIALPLTMLLLSIAFAACQPTPQRVKHLHQEQPADSALLAQMLFNTRMASEADKACLAIVKEDTLQYTLDDFGFWYTKTIKAPTDTLQKGQEVNAHICISEINGELTLDTKIPIVVGAGDLPTAINRALKLMCVGEQMRIISPWYAAYGIEGTNSIKPYSNLIILLTIEQ